MRDGFGVAGASGGNDVVLGRFFGAAGIAGDNLVDAVHELEYGFHAPEAAACEDGSLFARGGLDVHGGIGKRSLVGRHRISSQREQHEKQCPPDGPEIEWLASAKPTPPPKKKAPPGGKKPPGGVHVRAGTDGREHGQA